jgi:hypothetical protein
MPRNVQPSVPETPASCDVFIPLHPKDGQVVAHCIRSLHRHLVPRPARVVVLARDLPAALQRELAALGAELLDEDHVGELPPRASLPDISCRGIPRSGWYYQQFLKFEARHLSRTPCYAVMDADTVLLRRLELVDSAGRYVFDRTDQHHAPYFDTFAKLLGWRPEPQPSFIINYLAFDAALVEALIADIEARSGGRRWWEAILDHIDRNEMSAFSEFETYGYWLARHHAGRFVSRRRGNRHTKLKYLPLRPLHALFAPLRNEWSVSYHNHRRW